ncbi:hypothetical protein [Pseudomonas aeruginosa]|uniref:hypothetical protein n=1 Tax=Pseudomonas aeruginosa TaxID=287 RepID=UPI000F74A6E9|nr:hypothetical protein [Pseudomonas aeruginosa]MBG6363264.1 hypothetical protein [Pseudomonas aeruginosa]MBG6375052.1 hypothetical protein [Pseudomonas aeruginosa]MBG6575402.1 hypothetical protein [Pseudomonas aeruginosa]MBH8690634.1 hypothetical protein [Pseudomonas aeruginosa]MBH8764744.1 hypothetical protein [Pseudomonas aeruginosa]
MAINWPTCESGEFNQELVRKNEAKKRRDDYQIAAIDSIRADVVAGRNISPEGTTIKTLAEFYPSEDEMQGLRDRFDATQEMTKGFVESQKRRITRNMLIF